eukprot:COSAG02_NODE_35765_length_464_cov_0.536986_1_plen_84_part_10
MLCAVIVGTQRQPLGQAASDMVEVGGYPRDGEYFGQFWGAGVPRFGGGVRQDLQPAVGERSEAPRPDARSATWAWTQHPAANKK